MRKILRRQINNKINMTDGTFGIYLHLWEHMPKNISAESMLIEVFDKEGNKIKGYILLPHQLYLDDLIELSDKGNLDVFVTPIFPKQRRINIFEVEK